MAAFPPHVGSAQAFQVNTGGDMTNGTSPSQSQMLAKTKGVTVCEEPQYTTKEVRLERESSPVWSF